MPKFKNAKDYALYILKFRQRSRKELRDRLRRKGFSNDEIEKVIEDLVNCGLLDDFDFAQSLVVSRMNDLWSPYLIKRELLRFGIAEEVAEKALKESYDEEIVFSMAKQKLLRLLEKWKKLDPGKKREKIMNYFARRGHSYSFFQKLWNSLSELQ